MKTETKRIKKPANTNNRKNSMGAAPQRRKTNKPPRLDDIILTSKDGAAYSLGDVFQMLEIDLLMGNKKDFHKRLLKTVRALVCPPLCAAGRAPTPFHPAAPHNDP